MLDALTEACHRLQTTNVLPESHGAVPRLTLTMNLEDLKNLSGFGTAETGEQLSASTIRRLCCDSHVIPAVLGTSSEVLDVGRAQRLVTTAIWKALVARDQHCRFPHCTRPPVMCHATTSSTGSTAATRHWRTWSCSADTTTDSSTPDPGPSENQTRGVRLRPTTPHTPYAQPNRPPPDG